ncbi:3-dehydroquinate synthase, partial [Halomonas sp. BBD48]|nr:3-dehydroquinate synthase [Halomonas sp. BBD48]
RYSALAGLLSDAEAQRIVELLDTLGLATFHPQLLASGPDGELAILAGLREFREHLGGELTVTLLAGIGQGVEVHAIDTALMAQAIAWLKAREERHALAQ